MYFKPQILKIAQFCAIFFSINFAFSQTSSQTFNASGTFTVPSGVSQITVEAWGAGGSGGGCIVSKNKGGSGGTGGTYVRSVFTGVVPGTVYNLSVAGPTAGASASNGTNGGGSWFDTSATLFANGGLGGLLGDGAARTATTTGSIGTTIIAGGSTLAGGPGGSAGGAGGNGGGLGGAATTASSNSETTGNNGSIAGGGGSGAATGGGTGGNAVAGGAGASGQIIITYTVVASPPTIISLGSTSGCEGTSITINGTNLTGATAANVTIGGTPVTSITSNNGTTIVAVIGAGTTGTVSVTTPGGTATSVATFTVNLAPTITSTTPASGTGTASLTLGATASSGTISWYANSTGGAVLATGTSFTTPPISTTTTYYVEANNGTCISSPRTPVVASFATFSEVIVSVNWPSSSSENRVKIFNPSGELISTIDNGYLSNSNTSYSNTINLGCLEDLNNYYFTMYDGNNNGWDGADNITITVGGTTVINQNGDTANTAGVTVNFNVSGGGCALLSPLTIAPGGVTDKIQLWLKADKGITKNGADEVTTWATQAYGSNATIHTAGQEPTYRDAAAYNVNFNPVVDFDSNYTLSPTDDFFTYNDTNGDFMEGSSGFYTQEMFMVLIPDVPINSTFGNMDLFCGDESLLKDEEDVTGIGFGIYSVRATNEVLSYAVGTSLKDPGPYIGYGVVDNSTGTNYNNVGIINTRNSASVYEQELSYNANDVKTYENDLTAYSNVNNSRYWIGRSEAYEAATDARIAEIITYSTRKDDATERNKIESYLAIKYGITLADTGAGTTKDYVDSDGTIIWDHTASAGFNYDIAGIGRDDVSELNQKQSKTVNTADDITIGLNEIATTNNLNANTFASDKTFLVWGNDNATLNGQPAVIVDMSEGILPLNSLETDVEFTPMGRKWKVAAKGTNFSAKVSIPESLLIPLGPPPGDYLMFISDSPTFSPTSEYRIMNSDGLGNFQTNYTFSTTKYITFGFAPERTFVRSIQFNGSSDYLDAGNVLDLNPTGFTISAWIKRANTNASILSKRDNAYSNGGYDFKINSAGYFEVSWKNGSTQTITSSVVIPANVWHQVAVVYDGTDANLYIDGVIDTTANLSAPITNTESFLIAAADGEEINTTAFFNGNIDEVRVWDVALTENELRFVMNQEIETSGLNVEGSYFKLNGIVPTKYDISDGSINWSNLKGYYPMSTYTFTNCKDASGNGNTAAIKNLTTVDFQTAPLPYVSDANGPWDTAATWLNNTVQNLPNSLSIIDGVSPIDWNIVEINHDISVKTNTDLGREREVLALIVNSNELTIDGDNNAGTGNGLTITHYLKLDGLLDLQGESQLIQTVNSDFDATSTGSIERDQQGGGDSFRYNYWSSPVNSRGTKFTIGEVLRDGTDPTNIKVIDFGTPYPYADGTLTSPIKLSAYWMYVLRNSGSGYSAWFNVGNTGELLVGEGYTMKGSNTSSTEQNYTFVGTPNNGTINLSITTSFDYLVGNPYPSAIDADKFINDNPDTTGTIYFWEHYGGNNHILKDYQAGYGTYSLADGVAAAAHPGLGGGTSVKGAPEPYIPVGQAFFVVGSQNGQINFKNEQRIFVKESSGNSIFMKSATTKSKIMTTDFSDTRPKFRIGFEAPKMGHRQLLLTIDEKTTDGIDWGYDARIYQTFEDDMYWVVDENKYVIQATNTISLDKEIPLGIQTKEGGTVSINVDALENVPENMSVYIKDTTTGETYDITNQAFEIMLEAGDYNNRFVLAFQPRLKTLEEVSLLEGVHIFMNNTISELQLNKIVDTNILNASLFNLLGQQVKTWNIESNERLISLPIQIATGVYIVRVNTSAGMLTKKIIIE